MAKRKRSTGHIFSEKTRKQNAKIETAEYFEKEVLPKILNKDDIRTLSNPELRGMREYLKKQQKKIQREIELVQNSGETAGNFESVNKAIEERLSTRRILTTDPQRLLKELYRQEQFFNEYEVDEDYYYQRSRGTFDKILDDFDAEKSEVEKIADVIDEENAINIDDKWTILRRLAAINPRLNVDRAYASRTLKDIENAIESGRWSDINEITANFIEGFQHETEIDKQWDTSLRSFEDVALSRSSGFHGVAKALRKATTSVDNFAPVWSSPFKIREGVELTSNMSTPF